MIAAHFTHKKDCTRIIHTIGWIVSDSNFTKFGSLGSLHSVLQLWFEWGHYTLIIYTFHRNKYISISAHGCGCGYGYTQTHTAHGCDILTIGIGEKRYMTPFIHPFNPYPRIQTRSLALSLSLSTRLLFDSIYICFSPALSFCIKVCVFVPFFIIVRSIQYSSFTIPPTHKPSIQHIIWYIRFWFCLKNVHTHTHIYAKTD